MIRSKRIWPAPVLKNVIVLKIGPERSVNERSIETPKTTPKLDSTTANHHKTSYHMWGSRKFSLWVGRADGSTKFTITKIVWQIEGGLNPLSSPLWNHPCIVFMGSHLYKLVSCKVLFSF